MDVFTGFLSLKPWRLLRGKGPGGQGTQHALVQHVSPLPPGPSDPPLALRVVVRVRRQVVLAPALMAAEVGGLRGNWAGETCRVAVRIPGPGSREQVTKGYLRDPLHWSLLGPGVGACLRARLDIQEGGFLS